MRLKTMYTSVFLAIACSSQAHAAKNVEVVRYPTLLMIGNVGQSLGVSYSIAQHQTPNSSSSASSMHETYSFSTVAAILDTHLINLQIMGGLSYSQEFDDETSTLLDGEYNIVASAFDMSYHPITISSSRTTSVISNGYTPSYSLTSNINQVSAALFNTTFPVQVYYLHSTTDTKGLGESSSSASDAVGLSVHHSYKDVSDSRFSLSSNRNESESTSSKGYQISAGNYLSLDKKRRYRLSTALDLVDTRSGEVPQRNFSLAEELSCAFGPALTGTLSERFSYNSTRNFQGQEQTVKINAVSASLSHRLYQSVTSSISGSFAKGTALGGSNSSHGGAVRVSYSKILPMQSSMMLAVDGSRNVTTQDFQQSQLAALDEPHFGVQWGDRILPDLTGKLVRPVIVKSFNIEPEKLYVEEVDYRVDFQLGEIEILTGGGIEPGTAIAISYAVDVNPKISFQTDSIGTAANLSILTGRYTLSGNLSTQSQQLISGEAGNDALVSSTNLSLRAIANFNPTQFGLEYGMQDSSQENSSHIGGYATHSLHTAANAAVALTLRNTYSMVEPSDGGGAGSSQNTLSLAASYSRKFFRWINLSMSVAASDSRSAGRYSDFVTFRGVMSGGYNQIQFSLSGQTLYRITGSATTRDSNLSCSVTRYF